MTTEHSSPESGVPYEDPEFVSPPGKNQRQYVMVPVEEYDALRAPAQGAQWQPIKTAPKDGTAILGVWWSDISMGGLPQHHIGICSWAGAWTPYDRKLTHWKPVPAFTSTVHHPVENKEGGASLSERHPVETLWREVGLPEYFLGNGGTNTKLYALYEAIVASDRAAWSVTRPERSPTENNGEI